MDSHGTTIVGVVAPGAVVIAGDGRSSLLQADKSFDFQDGAMKVGCVGDLLITGAAGINALLWAWFQLLTNRVEAGIDGTLEDAMTEFDQAFWRCLANTREALVTRNPDYPLQNLEFYALSSGVASDGRAKLWLTSNKRTVLEDPLAAVGSGATPALREGSKALPILGAMHAIETAFKCVLRAAFNDKHTGGDVTALVIKPGSIKAYQTSVGKLCDYYEINPPNGFTYSADFPARGPKRRDGFIKKTVCKLPGIQKHLKEYLCGLQVQKLNDPHYRPNYLFILQTILCTNPQEAVNFALLMSQMEGGCPVDYNTIADLFLQAAKEDCEKLGVDQCIKLFEQIKSYEGLYFILGSYLSSSEDPEMHFKYIEAAAKIGQIEEVERVTRESNFYDAEKTKNFLIEVKLNDARPLINVCDRFGFVEDLTEFLEHLVSEGSQDVHVHNALGKIIVDSLDNPEHFLTTNPYYDSKVVGKYCEKFDHTLAVVAYRRGQCDDELIKLTNKELHVQTTSQRYVVERTDGELWEKVLNQENQYRQQLIDQVVSTALPESKSPEQVSAAVKAFKTAELDHELVEKIVLQNTPDLSSRVEEDDV